MVSSWNAYRTFDPAQLETLRCTDLRTRTKAFLK
jgi:hypothetical protein